MKVVRSSNKCELKLNVLAINCERLSHKHDMKIKYVVNFGTIFSGSILSFHSNLNQVGVTLTKCKIDGWSFLKSSDELGAQFENLLSFLKMACPRPPHRRIFGTELFYFLSVTGFHSLPLQCCLEAKFFHKMRVIFKYAKGRQKTNKVSKRMLSEVCYLGGQNDLC